MTAKRLRKKSLWYIFVGKLIVLIVIAALAAGAVLEFLHMYERAEAIQIKKISESLSALENFSEIDAAAEKGWSYPPVRKNKTLEDLNKMINDEIDRQIKAFFPKRDLMREKAEAIKKYRAAREGEYVEFQLTYSNERIRGIFRGREGLTIKIDDREMKIFDVLGTYRYLFEELLARKLAAEKYAKLDGAWQAKIDDFKREKEKELINKYYSSEGYFKVAEGLWKHESELVEEYVEKRRKEFKAKRDEAEAEIFAKNKIFGLFPVSPEKINEEKN